MQNTIQALRQFVKNQAMQLARPFGLRLLSKAETEDYLRPHRVLTDESTAVQLAEVAHPDGGHLPLFAAQLVRTTAARVWRLPNPDGTAAHLRSGNLRVAGAVPDTDFGNRALVQDLLRPGRRSSRAAPLLIAPWSHYWSGYFDFVFFVALKLCRILAVLSPAERRRAVVSYPLFGTAFEAELLALLGLRPDQIVDSRTTRVHFQACVLSNNESWAYHHPRDLRRLQQAVEAALGPESLPAGPARVYIRRAGRRQVANEEQLLALLRAEGFAVVEDRPRSLREQVALYRGARIIVGAHGASFANILWCRPGAHLLELFAPTYVPDYFRYLAHVLGLGYSAYCQGPPAGADHRHVADDMTVALPGFRRCLRALLN